MHEIDPAPDDRPEISVVVPLFNEEENIGQLHRRLSVALSSLEVPYEILFVNDGSRDATPRLIDALHAQGSERGGDPPEPELRPPARGLGRSELRRAATP